MFKRKSDGTCHGSHVAPADLGTARAAPVLQKLLHPLQRQLDPAVGDGARDRRLFRENDTHESRGECDDKEAAVAERLLLRRRQIDEHLRRSGIQSEACPCEQVFGGGGDSDGPCALLVRLEHFEAALRAVRCQRQRLELHGGRQQGCACLFLGADGRAGIIERPAHRVDRSLPA